MADNVLVSRPEFVREVASSAYGVVEKPLIVWEKLFNNGALRKGILLLLLAGAWQLYATVLKPVGNRKRVRGAVLGDHHRTRR